MSESSGEGGICKIRAYIREWFAVTSGVRDRGLCRSMTMVGYINDYKGDDWYDPVDERFHGKGIKLFLSAPYDETWTWKLCQEEGLQYVCGIAHVEANVIPKIYEFDGETVEDVPVQIGLSLSIEAFNAIQQQAYDAERRGHLLHMEAALGGKALPDGGRLGIVFLKDLDVSDPRVFAVSAVSFTETRTPDRLRRRVLPVEPATGECHGRSVCILLTEARWDLDVARGEIRSIACEGRVILARGKPYDGADVTVEFRQHEPRSATEELPRHAFFGEFSYHPKNLEEEYAASYLWLGLKHIPDDARELLLPMLSQESGTEVVLLVNLIPEADELIAATERLEGKVREYSFQLRKRLMNARPD